MAVPEDILKKLKLAEGERAPYEGVWDLAYKNYRNYIDTSKKKSHQANLFIPYTFATVETLIPRIYSSRANFRVEGVDYMDEKGAKIVGGLLSYQWRITKMNTKLLRWIKSALIYGMGVVKVGWKLDQREVVKKKEGFNFFGKELGGGEQTVIETMYDDPMVWNIDVLDFYPDPQCNDFNDDMRWCFIRRWSTLDELSLEGKLDKEAIKRLSEDKQEEMEKSSRRAFLGLPSQGAGREKVEVLEYWTQDKLVIIGNRSEVLYDEPNPYIPGKIPIVVLLDIPDVHFPYGIGEPEVMFSLQEELNDIRNLRLDSAKIAVSKIFKAIKEKGLDKDLEIAPGKVFWMDDPEALNTFETGEVGMTGYRESGEIKADIQGVSGVSDYQKGIGAEGLTETATGIISIQEAAQLRFSVRSMLVADAISQLGTMFYKLDQKFVDRQRVVKVYGNRGMEFLEVNPLDLEPEVDVIFDVETNIPVQKSVKRSQTIAMYQMLMGNPLVNQVELLKALLDVFDDIVKNPSDLLSPDIQQGLQQVLQSNPELAARLAEGKQGKKETPVTPTSGEDLMRQAQGSPGILGGFLGGMKRKVFGRSKT